MYIDTHTHISKNFGVSPKEFIDHAKLADVSVLIVSCCDKDSILEGLSLIQEYDSIYLTIGFHPDEVDSVTDEDLNWIESIIRENPKRIVGIGEIGLDYHFVKDKKEEQKNLFKKQLCLAEKLNLPVVIHSRDAIQETYDVLKKYSCIGTIHCYSGSLDMAKLFIQLGYLIGIGGVVTFSNSKLFEVVSEIGLSSIVLETDSPYLSPFRGQVNESKNIPVIAQKVSEILDVSLEKVAEITTANAVSLFDLDIDL